jgi:hypothetical protein
MYPNKIILLQDIITYVLLRIQEGTLELSMKMASLIYGLLFQNSLC